MAKAKKSTPKKLAALGSLVESIKSLVEKNGEASVAQAIATLRGNGHKPEESEQTPKQTPEQQAMLEEFRAAIKPGDIANAFTRSHHNSPVDYLVNPGEGDDNLETLMMRTIIYSKTPQAMRQISAITRGIAECTEFHNKVVLRQLKHMLALMTSADGVGREQLVKAITGENNFGMKNKGAGNAFTRKVFGNRFGGGGNPPEASPE